MSLHRRCNLVSPVGNRFIVPTLGRVLSCEPGLDNSQVGTYCLGTSLTVGDPSA
jgi:hypothetical protein